VKVKSICRDDRVCLSRKKGKASAALKRGERKKEGHDIEGSLMLPAARNRGEGKKRPPAVLYRGEGENPFRRRNPISWRKEKKERGGRRRDDRDPLANSEDARQPHRRRARSARKERKGGGGGGGGGGGDKRGKKKKKPYCLPLSLRRKEREGKKKRGPAIF